MKTKSPSPRQAIHISSKPSDILDLLFSPVIQATALLVIQLSLITIAIIRTRSFDLSSSILILTALLALLVVASLPPYFYNLRRDLSIYQGNRWSITHHAIEWTIHTPDGTRADRQTTIDAISLIDDNSTWVETSWGDGDVAFLPESGHLIETSRMANKTYYLIALDETLDRGRHLVYRSRARLSDSFTGQQEWVSSYCLYSRVLRYEMKVVFPLGAKISNPRLHCYRFGLRSSWPVSVAQTTDGRETLSATIDNARRRDRFVITWNWSPTKSVDSVSDRPILPAR